MTALERLKADIEGPRGKLAKLDAVRQVMTVKARNEGKVYEMTPQDKEIQRLEQQLKVCNCHVNTYCRVNTSLLCTCRLVKQDIKEN